MSRPTLQETEYLRDVIYHNFRDQASALTAECCDLTGDLLQSVEKAFIQVSISLIVSASDKTVFTVVLFIFLHYLRPVTRKPISLCAAFLNCNNRSLQMQF